MKQESWVQIIALVILGGLTLFYNPGSADFEGKIIFFSIILAGVIFLIIFDIYKKIEKNETKINLFGQKWQIVERIKNLEDFKNSMVKNKRGYIDPRAILLLIIALLIYLYIKSQS